MGYLTFALGMGGGMALSHAQSLENWYGVVISWAGGFAAYGALRLLRWRKHGHWKGTQDDSSGASGGTHTGYLTLTGNSYAYRSGATFITNTTNPFVVAPQRSSYGEPGEGASLSKVPDLAEPIVAARAWNLIFDGNEPLLCSTGVAHIWRPGERMEAMCCAGLPRLQSDEHPCPVVSCRCGIYAVKSGHVVTGTVAFGGAWISGKVKLWGKVIEGDYGYRAQFAYPESLRINQGLSDKDTERLRNRLVAAYGIPVTVEPKPELYAWGRP